MTPVTPPTDISKSCEKESELENKRRQFLSLQTPGERAEFVKQLENDGIKVTKLTSGMYVFESKQSDTCPKEMVLTGDNSEALLVLPPSPAASKQPKTPVEKILDRLFDPQSPEYSLLLDQGVVIDPENKKASFPLGTTLGGETLEGQADISTIFRRYGDSITQIRTSINSSGTDSFGNNRSYLTFKVHSREAPDFIEEVASFNLMIGDSSGTPTKGAPFTRNTLVGIKKTTTVFDDDF